MAEPVTKLPIKTEKSATPAGGFAQPRTTFDGLRREIDRVFRCNCSTSLRSTRWDIAPAVDVAEKDKEYEITAELPGLDEKNIEVKLANGTLTIKGEKKEEKEEKQKDYYVSERSYGSFMRSFQLPEGVDEGKIEASFAKGVLTVKLPKSAEARKNEKTISIKAA
jgi:HSP20 family protein